MTQRDAWWWALLGAVVLAVAAHVFFPRYEWRTAADNGSVIVVHDRWTGRFQRAEYDGAGKVKAMDVYTPF